MHAGTPTTGEVQREGGRMAMEATVEGGGQREEAAALQAWTRIERIWRRARASLPLCVSKRARN